MNGAAYGLGLAASAFGLLLFVSAIGLYVVGAFSFNYDLAGWAVFTFAVGLASIIAGWRIHKLHGRGSAARPPR